MSQVNFDRINKADLVHRTTLLVNEKRHPSSYISSKETNGIISAIFEIIMEAVADGDKVALIGFGSFEARKRGEREGRNPKTGEPLTIPATIVPAFSPGKDFKDAVKSERFADAA